MTEMSKGSTGHSMHITEREVMKEKTPSCYPEYKQNEDDHGYNLSGRPQTANMRCSPGHVNMTNLQVSGFSENFSKVNQNQEVFFDIKIHERKSSGLKRKFDESATGKHADTERKYETEISAFQRIKQQKLSIDFKTKISDRETRETENVEVDDEPEQISEAEMDTHVIECKGKNIRESQNRVNKEEVTLGDEKISNVSSCPSDTQPTPDCLVSPKVHEHLWCCTNGYFQRRQGAFSEFESNCGCTSHNLVDWSTRMTWCSHKLRHQYKVREVTHASPYRTKSNPYITHAQLFRPLSFTALRHKDIDLLEISSPPSLPLQQSNVPQLQQSQTPLPQQLPPTCDERSVSVIIRKTPQSLPDQRTSALSASVELHMKKELPDPVHSTEGKLQYISCSSA